MNFLLGTNRVVIEQKLTDIIGNLSELPLQNKTTIVDCFNSILLKIQESGGLSIQDLNQLIGLLSDLTTVDKSNVIASINEINNNVKSVVAKIGSLSNLNTTDKTNLTNAINEIFNNINNLITSIGSIETLNTTDKSSVIAAVNEINNKIESQKADIGNINDVTLPLELKGKSLTEQTKQLFQFASDGKSGIATVVGSPLLATDTFQQQKDKLQELKNILATNLSNKKVISTGAESLNNLINKVATIKTGLKYVQGRYLANSQSSNPILIDGFDFKPVLAIAIKDSDFNSSSVRSLIFIATKLFTIPYYEYDVSKVIEPYVFFFNNNNSRAYDESILNYNTTFTDDGVYFNFLGNSMNFKWIIFGE